MKKFTLLASAFLAFTVAVNAQNSTTKVSKQIKVLDWLNAAVVDGNQVEGGLHSYADWADLTAKLKLAQTKVGMLVTINADKATYRLKSWGTTTALPEKGEWENVGDMVIVANIAARNALIVTDNSLTSLATGTTVMVKDNGKGVAETFIFVNGLVDVGAPAGIDAADLWFSASSGASDGYIFFEQGTVAATTVATTNGWYKDAAASGAITIGTTARLSGMPAGVKFALTAGATVPVVGLPAGWANPTFYIKDGANTYQLLDCWLKTYQTIDGISYQVWSADNALLTGAVAGLELLVR